MTFSYEKDLPKTVGKAVFDILSQEQPTYSVEDILDSYSHRYTKEFEKCAEEGYQKFGNREFWIFVLFNKESWALNVQRMWMVARNFMPLMEDMTKDYPNFSKTLYSVNGATGEIKILWSVPGIQDCISVLKCPHLYDKNLVQWSAASLSAIYKDLKTG